MGGRNFAVLLLRDLANAGADACSIEAAHRHGEPQPEAMLVALRALHDAPPDFVAGFAAVLTDMLGTDDRLSDPAAYYESLCAADCGLAAGLDQ